MPKVEKNMKIKFQDRKGKVRSIIEMIPRQHPDLRVVVTNREDVFR
jgi:hypothetical protein